MGKFIASIKPRWGPAWIIAIVLGMMVFVPISASRSGSWEWYSNDLTTQIQMEYFNAVMETCYGPAIQAAIDQEILNSDEMNRENLSQLFVVTSLQIAGAIEWLSHMSWDARKAFYREITDRCADELETYLAE